MKQLHEVHAPTPMKVEQSDFCQRTKKNLQILHFSVLFLYKRIKKLKLSNKERGYNGRRSEGVVMFVHN